MQRMRPTSFASVKPGDTEQVPVDEVLRVGRLEIGENVYENVNGGFNTDLLLQVEGHRKLLRGTIRGEHVIAEAFHVLEHKSELRKLADLETVVARQESFVVKRLGYLRKNEMEIYRLTENVMFPLVELFLLQFEWTRHNINKLCSLMTFYSEHMGKYFESQGCITRGPLGNGVFVDRHYKIKIDFCEFQRKVDTDADWALVHSFKQELGAKLRNLGLCRKKKALRVTETLEDSTTFVEKLFEANQAMVIKGNKLTELLLLGEYFDWILFPKEFVQDHLKQFKKFKFRIFEYSRWWGLARLGVFLAKQPLWVRLSPIPPLWSKTYRRLARDVFSNVGERYM
ncbi:hypothetical protein L596_006853 [Steinernema carpocapsae]|uniref:Uncharacterized protein n=1 Tax=Steinernema carpocapsae TaxID=34508 RepID=A0A4U5P825_STECR|nr:hypothetical protein L596_006853 [Steinernema carpocapsae]